MGGGIANLKPYNPLDPAFTVYNPVFPSMSTIQPVLDYMQNTLEKVNQNKNFILNPFKKTGKPLAEIAGNLDPKNSKFITKHLITPDFKASLKDASDKVLLKKFEKYQFFENGKKLGAELAEKFDEKFVRQDIKDAKVYAWVKTEYKELLNKMMNSMIKKYLVNFGRDIVAELEKNPKLLEYFKKASLGGTVGLGAAVQVVSSLLSVYQVYSITKYLQKALTLEGGILDIPASETANMIASIVGIYFPAFSVASLIANAIGNSDYMQTSIKEIGTAVGALQSGVSTDQMREMLTNEELYGTSTYDDQTAVFNQIQKRFRELIKNKVSAPIARKMVKKEFAGQFAEAVKLYQIGVRNNIKPEIAYAKTFLPKFEELYSRIINGGDFEPEKEVQGPMLKPQFNYNPQSYGPSTGGGGYGGSVMPKI